MNIFSNMVVLPAHGLLDRASLAQEGRQARRGGWAAAMSANTKRPRITDSSRSTTGAVGSDTHAQELTHHAATIMHAMVMASTAVAVCDDS